MNNIIAPIIFGDTTNAVSDLQAALNKLGSVQINSDEINRPFFGETTCKALNSFKENFGLQVSKCLVDEKTADTINNRLSQLAGSFPRIINPLFFGMKSDAVTDLQNGLKKIGFGAGIDSTEKGIFGKSTCAGVLNFQNEMGIQVISCYVDNQTADKINSLINNIPDNPPTDDPPGGDTGEKYKVSGQVFDANNKIMDQQPVVAYDIDLLGSSVFKKATTISGLTSKGGIQLLGTGVSNADGFYNIEFTYSDFKSDESDTDSTADVIVLAVGGDEILGRSLLARKKDYAGKEIKKWDVLFFANVNKRGSTEFTFVSQAITKFLSAQITKIEPWQIKLNGDMLEFLSDEIAISSEKADAFVGAGFLLHDAAGPNGEIPAFAPNVQLAYELLYGLGRQSVKLEWTMVAQTSVEAITKYILQSSNVNIISFQDKHSVAAFAEALHNFAIKKTLSSNSNLKSALSIAIDKDDLKEKFHSLYANRKGSNKEFWDALGHDNDLKEMVPMLKLTNQLSALTGNHSQVMTRLAPLATGNNAVKLLELSKDDWDTAIGTDIPDFITGGSGKEKINNYRGYMLNKLHAAFYNQKVSLMAKNEDEIKIADMTIREMLNKFLTSTQFDLRVNRLHDKIPGTDDTFQLKLEKIGLEKTKELMEALNKVQRVFQFSPSPEVMTKILEAGIDSATMVVSMPFSTFKVRYKDLGDDQILLAIYQRASHIVSMIEYSILSLNRFSQSAKIPAITG